MADPTSFRLITEDAGNDVRVIALHGDADRFRADSVSRAIRTARADDCGVIVDLSKATYLDSSMLAALVGASEEGRRHAEALVIVIRTPRLRRSFELKGLHSILLVASSREQALELLAGEARPSDEPAREQG